MADPHPAPAPLPLRREARCACGSLRLEVQGDPLHVHACTCTQCQRLSGSAMTLSAYFAADTVTIHGRYTRHLHHGPDHPDRFRGFCPACGTGHFFLSQGYPGTIGISAGSFGDPAFPPPGHVLYWEDRPLWLAAPAGIKLYPEGDD